MISLQTVRPCGGECFGVDGLQKVRGAASFARNALDVTSTDDTCRDDDCVAQPGVRFYVLRKDKASHSGEHKVERDAARSKLLEYV